MQVLVYNGLARFSGWSYQSPMLVQKFQRSFVIISFIKTSGSTWPKCSRGILGKILQFLAIHFVTNRVIGKRYWASTKVIKVKKLYVKVNWHSSFTNWHTTSVSCIMEVLTVSDCAEHVTLIGSLLSLSQRPLLFVGYIFLRPWLFF